MNSRLEKYVALPQCGLAIEEMIFSFSSLSPIPNKIISSSESNFKYPCHVFPLLLNEALCIFGELREPHQGLILLGFATK